MKDKDDDKKDLSPNNSTIIADLLTKRSTKNSDLGGLVVEPTGDTEKDKFKDQLDKTLTQTEKAGLGLQVISSSPQQTRSWNEARRIVESFQPVPWFIWRISNFVLGTSGQMNTIAEGNLMGLRRLIFAAASDPVLGSGEKVNDMRQSLKIVSSDVIAAVSVIHAICRRLASRQFERIWRPILEDALLRCQIGCLVGAYDETFGQGRGMLAGFSSRVGLTVLLATGELEQARQALESLASGKEISEVGLKIYGCDPLQVSAMLLSAAGCGRDSAFGTVSYAAKDLSGVIENQEQMKWLAAFVITENIRVGKADQTDEKLWAILGLEDLEARQELLDISKKVLRRGHGWNWLL